MATDMKGIVGAPVTPFKADGRVDLETFGKQVNFLIEQGVPLIAHPMHIGESPNLTPQERKDLAGQLVASANGRIPVFVNASTPGTDNALDLARNSEKIGATGIVVLSPHHWQPEREAHLDHFMTIGGSVGIKMIAYNNPRVVQIEIAHDMLAEMIEKLPNFAAMKDASFNMRYFSEACRVAAELSPDFVLYTGIEVLLTSIPMGGSGSFSASSEVSPRLALALFDACMSNDIEKARPLQHKMMQMLGLLMENYPATIKYAMELMGRPVGETRKPIPPLDAQAKAHVRKILESLSILEDEPHGW